MRRWLIVALLGLATAGAVAYEYWQLFRVPLPVGGKAVMFDVAPGDSLREVANQLHARGVVRQPLQLVLLGRIRGKGSDIKAGEYRIESGTTLEGLLDTLVGGRVYLHSFTIIEGWTFHQLRQALDAEPALTHKLAGLDDARIIRQLGLDGREPEGLFMPDTYRFPKGTSDIAFLRRAHRAMSDFLEQVWPGRDRNLPFHSRYDALILASIVEKETALESERGRIAGVFVRRLRRGMRLQTDPTVIYGLGPDFSGDIRFRDLTHDTPYNTYTRRGLPPTPICMPSRASIRAVLHPEAGDALYFVAKGDGSHKFSATLEEHNRAVRKYQKHQSGD
ncbi:MAG: endolytic transglycosylase MltG [Gammaproteobacteria bacterium]|jgi:UPF0755 protein